jgi:hypothetical protein
VTVDGRIANLYVVSNPDKLPRGHRPAERGS